MKTTVLHCRSIVLRQRRSNPLRALLAALLISTCCIVPVQLRASPILHMPTDAVRADQANASGSASTPDSLFKGVDTVIIAQNIGPNDRQLANTSAVDTISAMTETVQQIFRNASRTLPVSWVKIKPIAENHEMLGVEYLNKPNVVLVTFVLSARQEMIAGKSVKVGALTWEVRKYSSQLSFAGDGVSYPFVMPDTKDELMQRIRDGVVYLASHLPRQFACGNKYGNPTKDCPDCALTVCTFGPAHIETP